METRHVQESVSVCSTTPGEHVANYEDSFFEEILPPATGNSPRMVEAVFIHVEPKQCSSILKELSDILPLEEGLSHLKRVRKVFSKAIAQDDDKSEGSTKRPKLPLQILVGSRKQQEELNIVESCSPQHLACSSIHRLVEKYGPLHSVLVPGRPPLSHAEWKEWNNTIWPTQFLPLRTEEYRRQKALPSPLEISKMRERIEESILKSMVVIVDPIDDTLLSTCRTERELQQHQPLHQSSSQHLCLHNNPLATPILLAIQGVSRREREATMGSTLDCVTNDAFSSEGGESLATKKMQYLCTGYDMYCYYEPTIFEAMACLHSRLRRLIYCRRNPDTASEDDGTRRLSNRVFPNGCSKHYIHNLPGTNHRYRVFEYRRSDTANSTSATRSAPRRNFANEDSLFPMTTNKA